MSKHKKDEDDEVRVEVINLGEALTPGNVIFICPALMPLVEAIEEEPDMHVAVSRDGHHLFVFSDKEDASAEPVLLFVEGEKLVSRFNEPTRELKDRLDLVITSVEASIEADEDLAELMRQHGEHAS